MDQATTTPEDILVADAELTSKAREREQLPCQAGVLRP